MVPEAIQRTIVAKASAGRGVPDVETIEGALRAAAAELQPSVIDNYAETYRLCHRRSSVPEASRWARKYLQARLDLGMDPLLPDEPGRSHCWVQGAVIGIVPRLVPHPSTDVVEGHLDSLGRTLALVQDNHTEVMGFAV